MVKKMQIDLKELLTKDVITLNSVPVEFDPTYYENTAIKGLKNILVSGKIYGGLSDEVEGELTVKGIMVLEDAYTLELVDYPFEFSMEENLKISQNNENILDITEILWQNIVLEVPISYSVTKEIPETKGEGWELNNQESKKIDSRFAKLTELLEKGKE